jgi:hypothetical protein
MAMLLRALALSLLLTSTAGFLGLHQGALAEEPSAAKEGTQVEGETDDIIFGDVFNLPKGEKIPEAAEKPITKVVTVHCSKPPGNSRGVVILLS